MKGLEPCDLEPRIVPISLEILLPDKLLVTPLKAPLLPDIIRAVKVIISYFSPTLRKELYYKGA